MITPPMMFDNATSPVPAYDPLRVAAYTGGFGTMPSAQFLTPAGYGSYRSLPGANMSITPNMQPGFFGNLAIATHMPFTYNPAVNPMVYRAHAARRAADTAATFGANALGFGAEIGLGAGVGMAMGGATGMIAGAAAPFLLPVGAAAMSFADRMRETRSLQMRSMAKITAGRDLDLATGMGFSGAAAANIDRFIRRQGAGDFLFKEGDYRNILNMGMESGMFDYAGNAEQYKRQLKKLRNTFATAMSVLGSTDFKDILKDLKRLQDLGASTGQMGSLLRREEGFARMAGMRHDEMVATYGQSGAVMATTRGLSGITGSLASMGHAAAIRIAQQNGLVGPSRLAALGGESGYVTMATESSLRSEQNMQKLIAAIVSNNKGTQFDYGKMEDLIRRVNSGNADLVREAAAAKRGMDATALQNLEVNSGELAKHFRDKLGERGYKDFQLQAYQTLGNRMLAANPNATQWDKLMMGYRMYTGADAREAAITLRQMTDPAIRAQEARSERLERIRRREEERERDTIWNRAGVGISRFFSGISDATVGRVQSWWGGATDKWASSAAYATGASSSSVSPGLAALSASAGTHSSVTRVHRPSGLKSGVRLDEATGAVDFSIGGLTRFYESGRNPAAVGFDKAGGTSYGLYQITSTANKDGTVNMDDFLSFMQKNDSSQAAQDFVSKMRADAAANGGSYNYGKEGTATGAAVQTWKRYAEANKDSFEKVQLAYRVSKTNMRLEQLKKTNHALYERIVGSPTLRNLAFDTVNHHGNLSTLEQAWASGGPGQSNAQLITDTMNLRFAAAKSNLESTGEWGKLGAGLTHRFFGGGGKEGMLSDLLTMNDAELNGGLLKDYSSLSGNEQSHYGFSGTWSAAQDAFARKYDDITYLHKDAKGNYAGNKDITRSKQINPNTGLPYGIDCSGFSTLATVDAMVEANASVGDPRAYSVFSKESIDLVRSAQNGNPALYAKGRRDGGRSDYYSGAAGMLYSIGRAGGGEFEFTADNASERIQEGMLLFSTAGRNDFNAGRYKNIGHVASVFRDPRTGKLMVAESTSAQGGDGRNGVRVVSLEDWSASKKRNGRRMYATDVRRLSNAGAYGAPFGGPQDAVRISPNIAQNEEELQFAAFKRYNDPTAGIEMEKTGSALAEIEAMAKTGVSKEQLAELGFEEGKTYSRVFSALEDKDFGAANAETLVNLFLEGAIKDEKSQDLVTPGVLNDRRKHRANTAAKQKAFLAAALGGQLGLNDNQLAILRKAVEAKKSGLTDISMQSLDDHRSKLKSVTDLLFINQAAATMGLSSKDVSENENLMKHIAGIAGSPVAGNIGATLDVMSLFSINSDYGRLKKESSYAEFWNDDKTKADLRKIYSDAFAKLGITLDDDTYAKLMQDPAQLSAILERHGVSKDWLSHATSLFVNNGSIETANQRARDYLQGKKKVSDASSEYLKVVGASGADFLKYISGDIRGLTGGEFSGFSLSEKTTAKELSQQLTSAVSVLNGLDRKALGDEKSKRVAYYTDLLKNAAAADNLQTMFSRISGTWAQTDFAYNTPNGTTNSPIKPITGSGIGDAHLFNSGTAESTTGLDPNNIFSKSVGDFNIGVESFKNVARALETKMGLTS